MDYRAITEDLEALLRKHPGLAGAGILILTRLEQPRGANWTIETRGDVAVSPQVIH